MPNNIVISAESISKSFKTKDNNVTNVLKNINMLAYSKEFIALMGPSGAGKSTFLTIIGCLDSFDSGELIFFNNSEKMVYSTLSQEKQSILRNKYIGFVFQFHHLLPEFNGLENVMMPSLISGISFKESKLKAEKLIDFVGLKNRMNHKPAELSGGEQQRLAIARALINNPKLILADEPTGNLDHQNSKIILELLLEYVNNNESTLIVATHSDEIAKSAQRIIKLIDGEIAS